MFHQLQGVVVHILLFLKNRLYLPAREYLALNDIEYQFENQNKLLADYSII